MTLGLGSLFKDSLDLSGEFYMQFAIGMAVAWFRLGLASGERLDER
jgi:hypothetical protein